jgi:hypothetical protein
MGFYVKLIINNFYIVKLFNLSGAWPHSPPDCVRKGRPHDKAGAYNALVGEASAAGPRFIEDTCPQTGFQGLSLSGLPTMPKKSIAATENVIYYAQHLLPDKAKVGEDCELPNALLHLSRRSQRKPE